jgi:DNA-binding transcriptional regulator YiaG
MTQRAEFCIKGIDLLAEPYHYVASGLDNIYLLNGVSHDDTPYGRMVTIKNLNGLHRAIGLHIIEKKEQMPGPEFRFLRKQMGLTQAELAKIMRVTDQTVANYEKGNTTDFGPADAFMRSTYFLHIIPDDMRAKIIKAMAEDLARHEDKKGIPNVSRLKMVDGWREHPQAKAA